MGSVVRRASLGVLICDVVAVALIAAAGEPFQPIEQQDPRGPEAQPVSLIALISNPQRFDGLRIHTTGFASFEDLETAMLFVGPADAENDFFLNGIWLELDLDSLNSFQRLHRKAIIVEGIFDAEFRGHLGIASGSVKDITSVREVGARSP